jgi:DNA-binding HxlR family transcriptional regulator
MLIAGPVRFNALRRAIQGLSQKVLSQTLKNLERDGLVTRTAIATVPVTVEYAITPIGRRLAELAQELIDWATDTMPEIIEAQNAYDDRVTGG